jgi:hypothetical protein
VAGFRELVRGSSYVALMLFILILGGHTYGRWQLEFWQWRHTT